MIISTNAEKAPGKVKPVLIKMLNRQDLYSKINCISMYKQQNITQ